MNSSLNSLQASYISADMHYLKKNEKRGRQKDGREGRREGGREREGGKSKLTISISWAVPSS